MKKIQIKYSMGGSGKTTLHATVDSAAIAEFMRHGQVTQKAFDTIIDAGKAKQKS